MGQKTRKEILDMFSRLKDFVEENSMETSKSGIDQCIKDRLVNLQSRFSKYFPEAISDKYKWIMDPFHVDSPQNYEFSLEEVEEENCTYSKVQFPRKWYIELWVGIGAGFPHPSRKASATSYLCETGF
jgi:hypothetical protein